MAKVHRFKMYDIAADEEKVSRRLATKECIAQIGATLIPDTEKDVPDFTINSDGFYNPDE